MVTGLEIMYPKESEGTIANIAVPDPIAPSGSALFTQTKLSCLDCYNKHMLLEEKLHLSRGLKICDLINLHFSFCMSS